MHIPIPLTYRSVILLAVGLIVFGLYLVSIKFKDKNSFEKKSGQLTYIADSYHDLPTRHVGKFRYLALDTYPYIIEVFIGKDFGDFGAKFEQVDNLKIGDTVTIYYQDGSYIAEEHINRTVKYIDSKGMSYFEDGNGNIYIGASISIISLVLFPLSYYAKKKGQIS
jgi:hypothetical protein